MSRVSDWKRPHITEAIPPQGIRIVNEKSADLFRSLRLLDQGLGEFMVRIGFITRHRRTRDSTIPSNQDLREWVGRQGHAIAYREFSSDYLAPEKEARDAKRGMWAGRFDKPSEWRQSEGSKRTSAAKTSQSCAIKGNISSKGEKIYHVPGGRYYDRTVINPSRGERMFCSEAEARAAGWRRSKL